MDDNVGVAVEHNCPAETVQGLQQRGHPVKVAPRMDLEFGSAQMAHVMEHGYLAASDHRKDGYPMGY
jgi:gamma-glutamyltranspeptidase/glutathione hydrolase